MSVVTVAEGTRDVGDMLLDMDALLDMDIPLTFEVVKCSDECSTLVVGVD